MTPKRTGLKWSVAAFFAVLLSPLAGWSADIPIRIGVVTSGGQGEVPYVIQQFGLDKKHGLSMQVVELSAPGQQYVMLRGDTIDMSPGSFVDLIRQRKAGVKLKAVHGRQRYNNRIVVQPNSPIQSFADLRGKRIGNYGTTFLDWLIVRAAGKRAFGIDLEKDATSVSGSPPLLNQFLAKDQVDAMLQFSTLTVAPLLKGDQRVIIDMPTLIRAAGFSPEVFNTHWHVSEKWVSANPRGAELLYAMMDDAYAKLRNDDDVWPAIAKKIGITDPAIITAYRDLERQNDDPPYSKSLLAPTQSMLDAIIAIAGEGPIGFTQIDPDAFLFPTAGR